MSKHKPKGEAAIVAETEKELEDLSDRYKGETGEMYEVELSGHEIAILLEAMSVRLNSCLSDYKRCVAEDNELVAEQIMGNARHLTKFYSNISRHLDVEEKMEVSDDS